MRRSESQEAVEVVCIRKLRETAKAGLYLVADTQEQKWIPKSLIEDEEEMDDGTVLLELPEWFAVKEGLV